MLTVDLAYLKAHPAQLPAFLRHQRIRTTPVSGGSICTAQRLTLDNGEHAFLKTHDAPPPGFFAAEEAGLRWLRQANAVPIPEVIAATEDTLVLEWVEPAAPSPQKAEQLGRDLARLHRSGAEYFGAPWSGYIGSLPLDNTPHTPDGPDNQWPAWFAERRLRPYLRLSVDRGALSPSDARLVDEVLERIADRAGPPEPPSRIHGDLWPGNILWSSDAAWLVDPAAHGGHRETDLALLTLFGGVPYLDRLLAAYQEVWPLAEGWRERVPLHQLYLLLVHTALFGVSYRDAVVRAAAAVR